MTLHEPDADGRVLLNMGRYEAISRDTWLLGNTVLDEREIAALERLADSLAQYQKSTAP